jgi:hypothetical protein
MVVQLVRISTYFKVALLLGTEKGDYYIGMHVSLRLRVEVVSFGQCRVEAVQYRHTPDLCVPY